MSLKLIELQVALPRTQDAGKLQEQMQQRGQNMQDHISASLLKQDEKKRKQVVKNEKKEKSSLELNQRSSINGHGPNSRDKDNSENSKEAQEEHPYKGKFIDFNG